jgi:hypothetical protein
MSAYSRLSTTLVVMICTYLSYECTECMSDASSKYKMFKRYCSLTTNPLAISPLHDTRFVISLTAALISILNLSICLRKARLNFLFISVAWECNKSTARECTIFFFLNLAQSALRQLTAVQTIEFLKG